MSKGLTTPQKSVLVRGALNNGIATRITPQRGQALQRRGYGTYQERIRVFHLNDAGWAYGLHGTQLEG